jgi:hypothetical protein
MRSVCCVVLTLLFLAKSYGAVDLTDIPDADAAVKQVKDFTLFDFVVNARSTPQGASFPNPNAIQFAFYCGFNASSLACNPDCTNPTKPSWREDCNTFEDSERELNWGQPIGGNTITAGFHTLPTIFPANGAYDAAGILLAEFDYNNFHITPGTAPEWVDLLGEVKFSNPKTNVTEADFTYTIRVYIHDGYERLN